MEAKKIDSRSLRVLVCVEVGDYDPTIDPRGITVSSEFGEYVIGITDTGIHSAGDALKAANFMESCPPISQFELEGLLSKPNRIPEEWRKFILLAPKNFCHGPFASRFVPCAYFNNGVWHMGFVWVDGGGADRLIACA